MDRRSRKRAAGFTLIEILVVIAIIAVLGSVAVVKYMAYLRDATIRVAEERIRDTAKTIEIYYAQNMKYPETLEELVTPQEEGKQSVLKASALVDPWKNPIEYTVTEDPLQPFDLVSYGPDLREGTDDDIRLSLLEAEETEQATTR